MKKFLKNSQEEVIEIRFLIKKFYQMTMTMIWGKKELLKLKFGAKKKLILGQKRINFGVVKNNVLYIYLIS